MVRSKSRHQRVGRHTHRRAAVSFDQVSQDCLGGPGLAACAVSMINRRHRSSSPISPAAASNASATRGSGTARTRRPRSSSDTTCTNGRFGCQQRAPPRSSVTLRGRVCGTPPASTVLIRPRPARFPVGAAGATRRPIGQRPCWGRKENSPCSARGQARAGHRGVGCARTSSRCPWSELIGTAEGRSRHGRAAHHQRLPPSSRASPSLMKQCLLRLDGRTLPGPAPWNRQKRSSTPYT